MKLTFSSKLKIFLEENFIFIQIVFVVNSEVRLQIPLIELVNSRARADFTKFYCYFSCTHRDSRRFTGTVAMRGEFVAVST